MSLAQHPKVETGAKSLKTLIEEFEREVIQAALAAAGGNQRRAARALGVLPTTFHEKLKRLGLAPRVPPGRERSRTAVGPAALQGAGPDNGP